MNKVSVAIAHSKVVYGMFILWQFLQGSISFKRPLVYHFSTAIHYGMVKIFEMYPQLQKFHASMAVFTFCTFVTNEPSLYNNSGTESMALMIGYQSLLYLAAAFLPYQWIYFLIGNTISNILVL